MVRPIVKRENDLLHQSCQTVISTSRTSEIVCDLWDTLDSVKKQYNFSRGCGIAAPQIGELFRISVVEYKNERYTLINPQLTQHSEQQIQISEGCMSFFKYRGIVNRFAWVKVAATDERGNGFIIETMEEDLSSLLQHELDHLDGVLYDERLAKGEKLQFLNEKPELS